MPRNADVQGLAEAYALFDHLPTAAHEEMAVELGIIARELSAAQHADVPRDTGALDNALTYELLLDRLKVKVGLLRGARGARTFNGRTFNGKAGGPFYGRIVENGRSAQTVLVTRRIKKRRVTGNGRTSKRQVSYATPKRKLRQRSSPNAGTFVGDPYKLRVKAQAGRPFVAQPLLVEVAESHLSDFWADALTRLGIAR